MYTNNMKVVKCEKCGTRYNTLTVSACPICREIKTIMFLYDLTYREALRKYKNKNQRK